jgi:DNA-binding transcriptional ArsR family regulator
MWTVCRTCSSPIRAEIDAALDRGEHLRDIAARSGISRASLSRHNRKCRARRRVAEYKNASSHEGRLFVRYEGQPEIHRDDWREQDCVLVVRYEGGQRGKMLTREEAAALQQQMKNRPIAAETKFAPGAYLPEEIPSEEIFVPREPDPDPIPVQEQPQPARGMSDLLAEVKSMLRGRCG